MPRKIVSILAELDNMVLERDKYLIIEAKADHFINSGINIIRQIEEQFSPEEADELKRRLFNSLKGKDFSKFERKIRQLKENHIKGTDDE